MSNIEENEDYQNATQAMGTVSKQLFEKHKSQRLGDIAEKKLEILENEILSLENEYNYIQDIEDNLSRRDPSEELYNYYKIRKKQIENLVTTCSIEMLLLKIYLYGMKDEENNNLAVIKNDYNSLIDIFNTYTDERKKYSKIINLEHEEYSKIKKAKTIYLMLKTDESLYEQNIMFRGIIINDYNEVMGIILKNGDIIDMDSNSIDIINENNIYIETGDDAQNIIENEYKKWTYKIIGNAIFDTDGSQNITENNNIIGKKYITLDGQEELHIIKLFNILDKIDTKFYVYNNKIEGLKHREARYGGYLIENNINVW